MAGGLTACTLKDRGRSLLRAVLARAMTAARRTGPVGEPTVLQGLSGARGKLLYPGDVVGGIKVLRKDVLVNQRRDV